MKQWYSASELAGLPGLPLLPNNVARKAKAQQWHCRPRRGRGGGNEYAFNGLPQQTQEVLSHQAMNGAVENNTPDPPLAQSSHQSITPQTKTTIEQRTDAWLAILKAYEAWCDRRNDSMLQSDLAFVQAYNQQQLEFPDWVYAYVSHLSRSTLKAKAVRRREAPKITALGGNYGHRRGMGRIDSDSDLQSAIKTCLAAGGKHWGASQIYDILQLEFGLDPHDCSIGQLRSWLRHFRTAQPQEWALYMTPDRAKGTISPAFGSRSQSVFRPNQVWEIDTMRVDIQCKTEVAGIIRLERTFVIACVDVFTRRAILQVSQQTNAEAVCLLVAAAILKWGVPEQIRTDHGKEYLSRRVQRFLTNLGVETADLRCLPGHPEQKPFVERFNRTFQHRDLVKSPFFVGHNVGDRQTLRAASSRDRPCLDLAMSVEEFQQWCDLWCVEYEQRLHGRPGIGLEGKSPLQVLMDAANEGWSKRTIQNPRELDFLMMAAPGKAGLRKVGRQGISVAGRLYVAADLATWIGKSVYVCFNPREPRNIYIYQNAQLTQFVCQAVWREAENMDLAAVANQSRQLYAILLQSVNQNRKRGNALLRKLAADPYSLIGQTAQTLKQAIEGQLHSYPAIAAVTEAIAAAESAPNQELLTIDLETYQQELQRLAAESEKQALQQEQQRSQRQHLEQWVECWQQQQARPALKPNELEAVMGHFSSIEGQGFLAAVTSSPLEEQLFWDWLQGKTIIPTAIVDRRSLLQAVLVQWQNQQDVSVKDKQTLLHYIQEPEGLGVLRAYTNPIEERQFQTWLSATPLTGCVPIRPQQ